MSCAPVGKAVPLTLDVVELLPVEETLHRGVGHLAAQVAVLLQKAVELLFG